MVDIRRKLKEYATERPTPGTGWERLKIWSGWRLFGRIFRFVYSALFWLILIGVLVAVVFFIPRLFGSGLPQYWIEGGLNMVRNTPLEGIYSTASKYYANPVRGEARYAFGTDVIKNEDNKDLGLKIKNFKTLGDSYLEGDPVEAYGNVRVMSLAEDSVVKFTCEIPDDKIIGDAEPKEVLLNKDQIEVFTAICEFPSGQLKARKKIDGKEVVLKAEYGFRTVGYFDIYTMSQNLRDDYIDSYGDKAIEKIFENTDNSKLNKREGTVKSGYTEGPMKLTIGSYYTQPFTEQGPFGEGSSYSMIILLDKASISSKGHAKKLNGLRISVPEKFSIISDFMTEKEKYFAEPGDGEFKEIYIDYEMNQNKLEELNEKCKEGCDEFEIVKVELKVNELTQEELELSYISILADYAYEIEYTDFIKVFQKEALTA